MPTQSTIDVIIIAFALGVILAVLHSYLSRFYVGKLARALLAEEVFSPDQARLPSSFGMKNSKLLYFFVTKSSVISRMIRSDDGKKFYVNPDQRAKLAARYDRPAESLFALLPLLLLVVLCAALLLLARVWLTDVFHYFFGIIR